MTFNKYYTRFWVIVNKKNTEFVLVSASVVRYAELQDITPLLSGVFIRKVGNLSDFGIKITCSALK